MGVVGVDDTLCRLDGWLTMSCYSVQSKSLSSGPDDTLTQLPVPSCAPSSGTTDHMKRWWTSTTSISMAMPTTTLPASAPLHPVLHLDNPSSPFESTTTLPREFGANYGDDDISEKLPLTGGKSYNIGGFRYSPE